MYSIIFKPRTYFELITKPKQSLKKIISFLRKYPRLQNLLKIKNKSIRALLINFYLFFVKKNKKLKYFFFENSNLVTNIYFNKNDLKEREKEVFNSLANNGIIIIHNVISQEEKNKILIYFEEIQNKKINSHWINDKIIDASSIKYKNNKKVEIYCMHKDLKYLPELQNLNSFLTQNIFGKSVDTFSEFFLHNCIDKEESDTYEDTNFHIDRYLPCLKVIYSPEEIGIDDAPFGFIKRTHKLNNSFMRNFFLSSNNFFIKNEDLTEEFKKEIVSTVCPANSLIVTFSNGLHKRNIFLKKNKVRKTVFFQFTKNFNNFSLMNFNKFN